MINLQNAIFSRLSVLLKSLAPADKKNLYHAKIPPSFIPKCQDMPRFAGLPDFISTSVPLHFRILPFVNRSFLVVRKCLSGKICRIMPRFAPLCIGVRYMVPWQTNNTFIGISYLHNRIKMFQFAPVCQAAEVSVILQKIGPNGKVWQSVANLGRG